jgi:hypothetical protein
VDLIDMTDRMARSFATHEAISRRTPQDEPWVISIDRVVNHTNEVIPEREKWLYVARLRALLAQTDLAKDRHVLWVMPPERWAMVQEEVGEGDAPPDMRLRPTHVLTAEFSALTNTSGRGRSDAYLAEYHLTNLDTGAIVWSDRWEVKRAVSGRTYD